MRRGSRCIVPPTSTPHDVAWRRTPTNVAVRSEDVIRRCGRAGARLGPHARRGRSGRGRSGLCGRCRRLRQASGCSSAAPSAPSRPSSITAPTCWWRRSWPRPWCGMPHAPSVDGDDEFSLIAGHGGHLGLRAVRPQRADEHSGARGDRLHLGARRPSLSSAGAGAQRGAGHTVRRRGRHGIRAQGDHARGDPGPAPRSRADSRPSYDSRPNGWPTLSGRRATPRLHRLGPHGPALARTLGEGCRGGRAADHRRGAQGRGRAAARFRHHGLEHHDGQPVRHARPGRALGGTNADGGVGVVPAVQ